MDTKGSFFLLILFHLLICCSGKIASFSLDARTYTSIITRDAGKVCIRTSADGHGVLSSNTAVSYSYHLYFSLAEVKPLHEFKALVFSLLKSKLQNIPPHINISSIIVSSDETMQPLLLSSLQSIYSALRSFKLEQRVKVAPMFSVGLLKSLCQKHVQSLQKVIKFLRRHKSFVDVEVPISKFDPFMVQRVIAAHDFLNDLDIPVIIRIQASLAFANLLVELSESISLKTTSGDGINVEICIGGFERTEYIGKEQEQVHLPLRRILLEDHHNYKIKTTHHDLITPITNPVTTPITPSGFVTIPATNPITVLPTPITVPSTNPVIVTPQPDIPFTNPVTTPTTNYPYPPPGTNSGSPTNSGQSWCVAKNGVPESELQIALDYACGFGGADCSAIQQGGSCYQPNTLHDHASYAFNSYYQKNPTPASCDFGGTASLVNTNPIACNNPASIPVSVPATAPPTPITVPFTIPPPPPPTTMVTPITSPVTTPTVSLPPPNVDPTLPPPGGGTVPVAPGNSGQTWCVAKMDASDAALQVALDYACGFGGADCLAIQQSGSCYTPNMLRDHASYAFNSYYQKNPTPASCDFGGIAALVNTNPSSGTCTYPSSSSSSTITTGGAPPGGGSTTVIGPTNPIGSSSPLGSESPTTTTTSDSFHPSTSFPLLLAILTTLFYFT